MYHRNIIQNTCTGEQFHILSFCIRMSSWNEAQKQCENHGLSLIQYDDPIMDDVITQQHAKTATAFGDVMFIGLKRNTRVNCHLVQAVRGFSVHFWKKLLFFAQMISNMYSFDPDIAQSIQTRLTPN